MNRIFAYLIIGAMILGVLVGWGVNQYLDADQAASAAKNLNLITDVFLRLIKMIIAPLVFTTLVAGIAHMEDAASVGRIGVKTMTWFIGASVVSLLLGLILGPILQPGAGMHLPQAALATAPAASTDAFSLHGFVTHLVPTSIFDAMAKNEILQIVVFSLFVGTAVAALDDKAPAVLNLVEQAASIMLKVTEFVMKLAPFAIFAALASTIATQGLEMLGTYAKFVLGFYGSMGVLWGLLFLAGAVVLGKRVIPLFREIRTPTLLAFSTASSEAAYPKLLTALDQFGVDRGISSFVLPLGATINMDGTALYQGVCALFVAQAFGVDLSGTDYLTIILTATLASIGTAGVPGAGVIMLSLVLASVGLPLEGVAVIAGIDRILDMARTALNVTGDCAVAVVVAKSEGELDQQAYDTPHVLDSPTLEELRQE